MTDPLVLDRARGALLGLATGDALGTTLEFESRDANPLHTEMVGGGFFGLEPGRWTDDTSMALCLADSLVACGGEHDATDLMRRFLRWYRAGENSATGECFDIGNITRHALERFEATGRTAEDGPADPRGAGNGTIMRLAPVAMLAASDAERAARLADLQSRTTHPAPVAHDACRFFAVLLVEAIGGATKDELLRPRAWDGTPEVATIATGEGWRAKERDAIDASGYVVSTLEATL